MPGTPWDWHIDLFYTHAPLKSTAPMCMMSVPWSVWDRYCMGACIASAHVTGLGEGIVLVRHGRHGEGGVKMLLVGQ